MCGRFTIVNLADFIAQFPFFELPDVPPPPRYNVAPTQPVPVVANTGENKIEFYRWGLIPSWADDPAIGNRLINARAETLDSKPSFRDGLRRRRCLVIGDSFYEWRKEPGGKTKTPLRITMKDQRPFGFAGIWDVWQSPDGSQLPTCTIITVPANELVAPIHDRMPAIIRPAEYRAWLEPTEHPADRMKPLLSPYPADQMKAQVVSRAVNNPKVDSRECIEPVDEEGLF